MSLASAQFGELMHSFCRKLRLRGGSGKSDKYLIRMQSGIVTAEVFGFESLYGFYRFGSDEVDLVRDARKRLE